jgi:hypothetical protein
MPPKILGAPLPKACCFGSKPDRIPIGPKVTPSRKAVVESFKFPPSFARMVLITIAITIAPITHTKINPIIDNINPDLSINHLNVAALMQM